MSVNNPHKKSFFRAIIDKLIYILTGEKPKRHRHYRPLVRPEPVEAESRQPIVRRKRSSAHNRNNSGLLAFFSKFITTDRRGRQSTDRNHNQIRLPVVRINYERDRVLDPQGSAENTQPSDRTRDTYKPKRKKTSDKGFSLGKYFGFGKREKIKSRQSNSDFKEEFYRALPGEGYALLNSFGFYVLAYLAVYLIYQFTETIVAANFNIDSVLFYYEIYFPIGNASPLWNRFNIIVITLASPFVSVMIALILLRAVLMREKLNPQLRLFLLWVAFHGATHFLGAFVAGIATSQGFGYVANWLYMNVFFRILISLIFLFLLTVTGYYSAVYALETLPTGVRQHRWKLSLALFSRFFLPWVIGGLFVIAVKYPDSIPQHYNIMVYDAIIIATMAFMIIPSFFNSKAKPRSLAERPSRIRRPPGILISLVAVAAMILFRLAFDRGIHFTINFSFDVGFYR